MIGDWNPVPKPKFGRGKPKRGDRTAVTDAVRKEIARRSMERWNTNVRCCERCGAIRNLTAAHMENASQGGSGSEPWNIALLCGTHGLAGSCHDWSDNTTEGRDWKVNFAAELLEYYDNGAGRGKWE